MSIEYDIFIDAKGLKCPQPLLQAKLGIKQINTNQVLHLEATDPHTDLDLEVWCARFNYTLIQTSEDKGVFKFWIKK